MVQQSGWQCFNCCSPLDRLFFKLVEVVGEVKVGEGGSEIYLREIGGGGGLEKIYSPWGGGGGQENFLILLNFPPAHPYV